MVLIPNTLELTHPLGHRARWPARSRPTRASPSRPTSSRSRSTTDGTLDQETLFPESVRAGGEREKVIHMMTRDLTPMTRLIDLGPTTAPALRHPDGRLPAADADRGLPAGPRRRASPHWYPLAYAAKVAIVAALAWACRSTWRDLRPLPEAGGPGAGDGPGTAGRGALGRARRPLPELAVPRRHAHGVRPGRAPAGREVGVPGRPAGRPGACSSR